MLVFFFLKKQIAPKLCEVLDFRVFFHFKKMAGEVFPDTILWIDFFISKLGVIDIFFGQTSRQNRSCRFWQWLGCG